MTTRRDAPRAERFTARLRLRDKTLLERAAELRGMTLSAYVFEKARAAATAELAEAGEITLAPAAQRRFVELILDSPAPTPHLVRALKLARPPSKRR